MSVKERLRRPSGTQDFFIGVATQHWRAGLKSPAAFQAFSLALACWAKISGGLPGLHPSHWRAGLKSPPALRGFTLALT